MKKKFTRQILFAIFFIAGAQAHAQLSKNEESILSYLENNASLVQPILSDFATFSTSDLMSALNSISPSRNEASSFIASQLAFDAAYAITANVGKNRILKQSKGTALAANLIDWNELLAANKEKPPAGNVRAVNPKPKVTDLWAAAFGDFITQKGQNDNPRIHDTSLGFLVGWDRFMQSGTITISGGATHNSIREDNHAGHGDSNGAVLGIYGTGTINFAYIEAGVLGAYNDFHMLRNIGFGGPNPVSASAKSIFNVWQLIPHLGGGYDLIYDWGVFEPYVSFDWSVNYQRAFTETGAGILDMSVEKNTSAIFRSEVGTRFYETWDRTSILCILEESISYVIEDPSNASMKAAIAAAGPATFKVETYDKFLNLFSFGMNVYLKFKPSNIFLQAVYSGKLGSGYYSNDIQAMLGVYF